MRKNTKSEKRQKKTRQAQEHIPSFIEDKHVQKRHAAGQNKTNLLQQKRRGNKRRQKQKIVAQAHKDRSTTNLYIANTREVDPRSRDSEGVVWWQEEKGVYIWFLAVASFGNIPCWNGILPKIRIQQEQTKRDFVIEWVVKERECIEFTQ